MNGEYIELNGPGSDLELVSRLVNLLDPLWIDWGVMGYPALTLADGSTLMVVDFDPGGGAGPTLAIGNIDEDDQARWAAARNVYRALLAETDWHPRWTYDTPDGEVPRDVSREKRTDIASGFGENSHA